MFGRTPEARTYTEQDVLETGLRQLKHGDRPPSTIATVHQIDEYHRAVTFISREALKAHNAGVAALKQSETVFESPRPQNRLRKTLLAAASIFTAGAHR